MSENPPATPATEAAERLRIEYRMVHHGPVSSAEEAAQKRGISIDQLAKTLVVRVEEGSYVMVLVPGDRGMDYKKLRAHLGVRRLTMPDPTEALAATGYERGTITPLGAGDWPVLIDPLLMEHDEISLGAGVGGWAIHLAPKALVSGLGVAIVDLVSD